MRRTVETGSHPAQALDRLVDARYLQGLEAATQYVRARSAGILQELGFFERQGDALPAQEIAARLGVHSGQAAALAWLLEVAATCGCVGLVSENGRRRYVARQAPGPALLAEAQEALHAQRDVVGTSAAMFNWVAQRYPAVLRGERSGAAVLLKGQGLCLWESYFSRHNPLYQIHNEAAAVGVEAAVEGSPRAVRVLELGAGTGGGTAAMVAHLTGRLRRRVASFTITDVAPSLLVRVVERLQAPPFPFHRRRLDFNRAFADQGLVPGSFDLVVGINALHNATDLASTLEEVRTLLVPDGRLVISEALCEVGRRAHQDFVFNLLPRPPLSHGGQRLAAGHSRFGNVETWRGAVAAARFSGPLYANQAGGELALLVVSQPN